MRTRLLGPPRLPVSELALGTWGLTGEAYGYVEPAERDRVIDRALELGVTVFETADVYGRGEMEKCLGERLAGKDARIVTKVGTFRHDPASGPTPGYDVYKRFDGKYLKDAVKRSCDRLKREKIDVVLLHNPSASTMAATEAALAMNDLKQSGVIGTWGISAGDSYAARAALGHGAEVIELPYNVFFSRELHDLAGEIRAANAGVLARSVLSYGLLAGLYIGSHSFPANDHRSNRWTRREFESRIRQLDAVRPLVTGNVLTLRAAAVRFALANEMVSSVVLGPKSVSQLEELVREAGEEPPYLTTEALTQLATDLAHAGVMT
ncbi:MAG TPA: aldo/keto reductase [Polyangiaceae bacterium]|nr:aldo/keto reductase [Polyangiaceae bacterium]